MKIAILGWGSLIWQPKDLAFNKEFGWKPDGPILPIEFARISNDGRLTLVITEKGTEITTLYALSNYHDLHEAIFNLAVREGSGKKSIGYYDKNNNAFFSTNLNIKSNIEKWIEQTDFDAVIWTDLPEKLESKDPLEYLKSLTGNKSALAEEYIRRTPIQIKTALRTKIEKELNWKLIE
ncbi:hypothetical protein [Flavobacterium sp. GSP6]|uniref:hypothetical protein n=1 Tax=Flavobacterium sp. GSP6 TaxID=2497488 RepID=UPI000F88B42E|nr:hypothetical protein [Flavobacterium sp. GSP6]RTZ09368.1 hypothetical protein EKM03_01920 [Flavobacterium sp. GSP6]